MSKLFLKIKIKSLAEAARIIRLEEQRRKGPLVSRPRDMTMRAGPIDQPNDSRRFERYRRERPLEEGDVYFALHAHRTWDVRREARAALLAYAFIRGRAYQRVEVKARTDVNGGTVGVPDDNVIRRTAELIAKYGSTGLGKSDLHDVVRRWIIGMDVLTIPPGATIVFNEA